MAEWCRRALLLIFLICGCQVYVQCSIRRFLILQIITWLRGFLVWNCSAPEGGMCKAATPAVKQSRASQWRTSASRRLGVSVDLVHYDYPWTCDLCINLRLVHVLHVYGVWWFHAYYLIATNQSSCINWPHKIFLVVFKTIIRNCLVYAFV